MREIINSLTQEEKDALDRQWFAPPSDTWKKIMPDLNEEIRDFNSKGGVQIQEMIMESQVRVIHVFDPKRLKRKGLKLICNVRHVGEKETTYGVFNRLAKKGILFEKRMEDGKFAFGLTDFGVCVLDEIGIDFRTERERIVKFPRFLSDISKN